MIQKARKKREWHNPELVTRILEGNKGRDYQQCWNFSQLTNSTPALVQHKLVEFNSISFMAGVCLMLALGTCTSLTSFTIYPNAVHEISPAPCVITLAWSLFKELLCGWIADQLIFHAKLLCISTCWINAPINRHASWWTQTWKLRPSNFGCPSTSAALASLTAAVACRRGETLLVA